MPPTNKRSYSKNPLLSIGHRTREETTLREIIAVGIGVIELLVDTWAIIAKTKKTDAGSDPKILPLY